MSDKSCDKCNFRKRYDDNPKSILGRIWRWHANWCPGWKGYMNSLENDQRNELAKKYNMEKFMVKA